MGKNHFSLIVQIDYDDPKNKTSGIYSSTEELHD